jgi:hypothetical protein
MSAPRFTKLCTVLITVAALLSACSRHIEAKESPSPDGNATLRVEDDLSGGAAVSDVTSVFLMSRDSSAIPRQLVFKGTGMWNFTAKWQDNDTVELSYTKGYVAKCDPAPVLKPGQRFHVRGCQ